MKPPDREPTSDDLAAMAYADGELASEDRRAFEERLAREPGLARAVSDYRALELLAREMAPTEPADHEWARLARDPLQRIGVGLGWVLFTGGVLGLAAWLIWALVTSDLAPLAKGLCSAAVAGFALLLLTTLRARLRVLPLDPYRKVQR